LSHIVTIETKVHDLAAIGTACRRLDLPEPREGAVELYSGKVSGLIVQFPGWEYPAVIDPITGSIKYDNFGGAWGDEEELHRFLQMYAVEKCRIEARKKGYQISEQSLENGSIKLQVIEAAV
jgi:hypothetical protein